MVLYVLYGLNIYIYIYIIYIYIYLYIVCVEVHVHVILSLCNHPADEGLQLCGIAVDVIGNEALGIGEPLEVFVEPLLDACWNTLL